MVLRTCLRCDWEGDADDPSCPNCGTRLYLVGTPREPRSAGPPAAASRIVGSPDQGTERIAASSSPSDPPDPPPSLAQTPGSSVRSTRRAGPFVLSALGLTLVVGFWLGSRGPSLRGAAEVAPHASPTADGSPTQIVSPPPTPEGSDLIQRPRVGRDEVFIDGVPMSFTVRRYGWEHFGDISINKSILGPQGAEAMIFWTSFPDGEHANPCARLSSQPVASSVDDLAFAVSTAPGIELVSGPSDVTVDGRAAQRVVLVVLKDLGCDPGYFFTWRDRSVGAFWSSTHAGDTIRLWIVRVRGTIVLIEAETTTQASAELEHEIEQIVGSIRFDSR
jgi:hypothetical protein